MDPAQFHYELPPAAIAQSPVEPRDAARLFDADAMTDHRFRDLAALLDPGDLVVVNRTRVRSGRIFGQKRGTGGRVEALLLEPRGDRSWRALLRPARRLRSGVHLEFGEMSCEVVQDPVEGVADLVFDRDVEAVEGILARSGEVPLPPYFHGRLADPERYQTIFADTPGSAAAPTAGLHFTPGVVDALAGRGIDVAAVDLTVGLDTFRPISAPQLEDHRMHRERISVPAATVEAVAALRQRGGRLNAVGTTVVRALESVAAASGMLGAFDGETDLFITPGFEFKVVDRLITNFHVPGSTLVVMLAAFMGPGWRSVYSSALERGYRFLSFGDAMLVSRR